MQDVFETIRASNDPESAQSKEKSPTLEHALFYYQTAGWCIFLLNFWIYVFDLNVFVDFFLLLQR